MLYLLQMGSDGYVPIYTRNEITDALHKLSGFRTDCEIISMQNMKKIQKKLTRDTLDQNQK
ncbi:MAG: hypothetical protein SOX70_00370 [Peptoniphilaceae bacterium]|nr:hypothetical protein [Peptoniphilaceae bacterium]